MKKTILTLAVTVFIAGTMLTNCKSSTEKVENAENKLQEAKDNVIDAKQDLNKTRKDSITEYQKFKKESEEKINAHDLSIAEFKARVANEKKENRAKYEKKLAELEQKNSDLKKKLEDYKEDGKDNWDSFKLKFNHDLDELGKALKGFTVNNTK